MSAWGCRAFIQNLGCQAAWCPHGPCDQDCSHRLLALRPFLVTCLEPHDFFFSVNSLSLLSSCVYLAALCPLGFVFRSSCSGSFSGWAWPHAASPLPDPSVPGSFGQNSRLTKLQPPAPMWPLRRDSSSVFHMAEQVNCVVDYTALAPEWEMGVRKPLVSDLGWSPILTCHPLLGSPTTPILLCLRDFTHEIPPSWETPHPYPPQLWLQLILWASVWRHPALGSPHCCVPQPWPESRRCRFFLPLCHPAPLHHLHEGCVPHCTAQFKLLYKN